MSSILSFLSGVIAVFLTGCTLIGLAVGSGFDKAPKIPEGLNKLSQSKSYRFVTAEGDKIEGVFLSIGLIESETYKDNFEESKAKVSNAYYLPSIGDTIFLNSISFGERTGEFYGFDHESTYIRFISPNFEYRSRLNNGMHFVLSDSVGNSISSDEIKQLISDREVSTAAEIILKSNGDTLHLPVDMISKVEYQQARRGKLYGSLIGLTIDVIVMGFALSQGIDIKLDGGQ